MVIQLPFFSTLNSGPLTFLVPGPSFSKVITAPDSQESDGGANT